MADIVDAKTRSKMMARITGKNTRPEMIIRRALFAQGLRYRLHYKGLPGKPDIMFPKFRAIVLVNGCFWHGHNCKYFKWPATRPEFWKAKLKSNMERDERNKQIYKEKGWRTAIVWECMIKRASREDLETLGCTLADWVRYGKGDLILE